MTFTDDYAGILLPFVEKYKTAKNEKARKAVLKNAAEAVSKSRDLREDNVTELPKDLPMVRLFIYPYYIVVGLKLSLIQAISRYIKLSIQKESNPEPEDPKPKPKKVKQLYTIRDVIKQIYQARIDNEIPFESNDPNYIGRYQLAVTAVLENMTEEELEAAGEIAKDWSEKGAPPEVPLK
jgi:hypothetical protein